MNVTPSADNPLEDAEAQLREIFQRRLPKAPAEAGTLGRILAHVVNIRRSVRESSLDHVNAAKRLGDFAMTINRMAQRLFPSDHDTAARMTGLADSLRAAGDSLASNGAAPQAARTTDSVARH